MPGLPPEVRERALREEIVRYSFEGLYRRARRRLSKSGISDSDAGIVCGVTPAAAELTAAMDSKATRAFVLLQAVP